jgi:hypothetical protein
MQLRPPPSLVSDRVRALPVGAIFVAISRGYGLMPSYATPLPPRDRYAVVHFVRVLQQRETDLASLPAALQQEAKQWLP